MPHRFTAGAQQPLASSLVPPTLRERLLRAMSVPVIVGVVVFGAAVVSAMVMAFVEPYEPVPSEDVSAEHSSLEPAPTHEGAAAGTSLRVHVIGEVLQPGVVELAPGSRVEDAVAAAGGPTAAALLSEVNLARLLVDGEQLVIPDETHGAATTDATSSGVVNGVVNINRADRTALEMLPGVGPQLAQRIIDWRAANGAFSTIEQLTEVTGIGQKKFEALREQIAVG